MMATKSLGGQASCRLSSTAVTTGVLVYADGTARVLSSHDDPWVAGALRSAAADLGRGVIPLSPGTCTEIAVADGDRHQITHASASFAVLVVAIGADGRVQLMSDHDGVWVEFVLQVVADELDDAGAAISGAQGRR